MQKLIRFQKMLPKGSVLVFSLLVLTLMLTAALSIMSASFLERKASLSTSSSTKSFQVASSGVEEILYQVNKGSGITDLQSVAAGLEGGASCDSGVVKKSLGSDNYEISFYTADGSQITDCNATQISDVDKIKSVGSSSGASRAVEVAVAAGTAGITGGCSYEKINANFLSAINYTWGDGCKPVGTTFQSNSAGFLTVADLSHICGLSQSTPDYGSMLCISK